MESVPPFSSHFRDTEDLSGSREVICHVNVGTWIPSAISYWWSFGTKPLSLTVSEIYYGEYDSIFDMTSETTSKQRLKVIHFGTNQFLIYDFL